MRGLGERCIDRGLVAQRPCVALVSGCTIVDLRRAGFQRVDRIDHSRQDVVIDVDQLRRILRLVGRLGDHHRHAVADVAHLALGQQRVRRLLHRLPVGAGDQPTARQAVDPGQVIARIDSDHTRRSLRLAHVDLAYFRVRVRGTQEVRVSVLRWIDVVGVLAGAGQEADVFLAADRLADGVEIVRAHDYLRMAAAP